ncbi:thylakoidal processing peptidase 1, chloroplastic-like isoform X2 [Oryza glaberrima]|uniref:thylakoidal processing peptidase 1, chloroplastic-like isoform X2 n=1 Tax=Oryza glaberrima TaxID=4538 RepID=UPI00224BF19B|nr:thylakoidal processing peptidase 1, chloroplastic-like isoform X2 [Oryza glaberrima]
MAMGPPRLLRGLIPQLLSVDAWLPCTCSSRLQLLLSHFHCRLHLRWPSCADAFKLLLVLLLVSAALAEVRYIASSSMAPTLRPADRAVAERITYFFRRPSIGDIVFFKVPTTLQNYGVNKDVVFIKRILATPGDFIEVRQGQLIINGVARKEHYTASHASYTMEAMRLPEGHVFVMGDNRNNSCDSRAWGPLPISNIIGRYMMSFTRSSIQ